jgi:hypothetical protein
MTQLIDLGKIRFYFAGLWDDTTTYELNDVVKYGGNVYIYVYALASEGYLPTNENYWALMIEGIRFTGVWDEETEYRVGDGIAWGGKVYISIKTGSGHTPPNATYWSQFADGIQYEGNWSNVANYQKNDIVVYGPDVYIAKQDNTNQNPPVSAAYWDPFVSGVDATGVWNSATAYKPNQLAAYGARIYLSLTNNTNKVPSTNPSDWTQFIDGIRAMGVYSSATQYHINDIVTYGSTVYIAKGDTINHTPTDTTYWNILTSGTTYKGVWATATQYLGGDIVQWGGNTYITDTFHSSASSFATDKDTYWEKYNSGIRYRGAWQETTFYIEGDVVNDGENSRIALSDHTSSSFLIDDEEYWDILAKGATGLLPGQGGKAGYVLTTDGAEASFERDVTNLYFGDGARTFIEGPAALTDVATAAAWDTEDFAQAVVVNNLDTSTGDGLAQSADFIAYTGDSTNTNGWADLGFTGKNFESSEFGVTGPGDGYVFAQGFEPLTATITGKELSSNVATITTDGNHGFEVGRKVKVQGPGAPFEGTFVITNVTATEFSYNRTGSDIVTLPAAGTATMYLGAGNLVLATGDGGSDNKIIIAAGGFSSGNEQISITPDENVHIEIDTASTSATTGALTVVGGVGITGDQYIAGDLTVIGNVDLQGVTKLPVGSGATAYETSAGLTDAVIIAAGTSSSFVQNSLVNLGTGASTSADYIAYAAEGDNVSGWIDMGITGANFSDESFGVTGPHDGYIFMSAPDGTTGSGNLVLATDNTGTDNKIIFAAGGLFTGNEQMSITPNQNVHIEIATPSVSPTTGAFTVVGGMGVQGDINVAGAVNIAGEITFGGSGTVVETENLAVVNPMVFVASGNPTGDGLTFAFLGESRSQRTLTLSETVTFRSASNNVATIVTGTAHDYEVNDSVVISGVDDLASLSVVIVYEVTGSTTARITTSLAHGLLVGQSITVSGVSAAVNGTYTIATVPSATTLTYTVASTTNVAPSPVSGLVQRVSLPNVYNGTYTITGVPTPTTFTYTRVIPDEGVVAPSRTYPTVVSYSLTNGIVTLVLNDTPQANVGESILVAGVTSQLNGTRTVTARTTSAPFSISFARALDNIAPTTLTTSVVANIISRNRTSGVATLTTSATHAFVPGQSIVVANVSGTFDGTYTITSVTGTTISYSQALSDVIETAGTGGTTTATYPSYGSYKLLAYLGACVVTNPLRGQYTGLARNQARQVWYLVGGLSTKPTNTIDFSVPGTTFTREDLNVDTLEARNAVMDFEALAANHAVTRSYVDTTPLIINASTSLVAKRHNVTTERSPSLNNNGNYFVIPATGMVLTLPASPILGDTVIITDIAGTAGSVATKPIIARNGQLIQGKAEDMTFDVSNASIRLVYSNTTYGWRIMA